MNMPPNDWYYTVQPIWKSVSKQELEEYIGNYPRKLEVDVCGISDPPLVSWNDFELADRWPFSIVARTYQYSDQPGDYFYTPENERSYYIIENIEDVFNSKTGRTVEEWEEKEMKTDRE